MCLYSHVCLSIYICMYVCMRYVCIDTYTTINTHTYIHMSENRTRMQPHIHPCIPARFTLSITGPASSTASWKVSIASTPSSFIVGLTSAHTNTPRHPDTQKDRQTRTHRERARARERESERARERESERDDVNTQSTTRSQSIRRLHCLMQMRLLAHVSPRLICGNLHLQKFRGLRQMPSC